MSVFGKVAQVVGILAGSGGGTGGGGAPRKTVAFDMSLRVPEPQGPRPPPPPLLLVPPSPQVPRRRHSWICR